MRHTEPEICRCSRWTQAERAFEQAFGDDRSNELRTALMQVTNVQPATTST